VLEINYKSNGFGCVLSNKKVKKKNPIAVLQQ
jgi:hypothetical protein